MDSGTLAGMERPSSGGTVSAPGGKSRVRSSISGTAVIVNTSSGDGEDGRSDCPHWLQKRGRSSRKSTTCRQCGQVNCMTTLSRASAADMTRSDRKRGANRDSYFGQAPVLADAAAQRKGAGAWFRFGRLV